MEDPNSAQISMQNFKDINIYGSRVTFGSGITYAELTSYIGKKGLALSNMPSTPHLNIVGSVITGSHGSGHKNQIIAG
jgi:xylitol oxidase